MIYTIGHSTHELNVLTGLLTAHGVTAVCDVRSHPYSRMNSQFNRENLKAGLDRADIAYAFLGAELGARSTDPGCYRDGVAQYDRIARTELFNRGLDRVAAGSESHRIALLCAEKEPLECHRTILVARNLVTRGLPVSHIHADGRLEAHEDALLRLLALLGLPEEDLFRTRADMFEEAYTVQGERIAYAPDDAGALTQAAGAGD